MQKNDLIAAAEFCTHYNIEYSFISSLSKTGIIEIATIQETEYIPTSQLSTLEKLVRLHTDLDINVEGIEAISYLLRRVERMQKEINRLKNILRTYESLNHYEEI
jgi:hypothetical protein